MLLPNLASAQTSLPFTDILFIERGIIGGSEIDGSAFCDQYYGHNGRTGGGLFLLKDFQSTNPQKVDVVAGLTVPAGKTNAGQTLSSGTFLSPDLSYDGKTVVFAWSSGGSEKWSIKNRFHLFKVDIDGENLVQITDGNYDDIHPAWMPSGRIVFVSTRRGGYARDAGHAVPTYTLHSVKADGSDLIRLSHHEANEFHPSITNDGRIVYTRWDYIDRDSKAAHHPWFCDPDGSRPESWGGNYALPLDTMTGSGPWTDGRTNGKRPLAEFYPRAIPGSSTKFVAVAGPHHEEAYGTLIIRDFGKVDDNQMGQVTKLTPDVGFPETSDNGSLSYGPAWPLSQTLFLTSYDNRLVLLDTSVTPVKRTELYQTSDSLLRPIYPIPVAPRGKPPVVPETTYQGERWSPSVPPATVQIYNVRETDSYGRLPDDVRIKSMRIVQVLPKSTPIANDPRLGFSSQNVAKISLGTVPVESDGSVFFEAPIGRTILFQLLDDKGMAVQTMRSATYLHPGENMFCIGCHEEEWWGGVLDPAPLAFTRPASKVEPEVGRVEPINFARTIAPILKTKCFSCHQDKTGAPTNSSYSAMQPYAFWFAGDANGNLEPVHGGSRSKPGMIGARGSRMGKALLNATHQQALTDSKFTWEDMRRLTQWLDLGSDELGSYENPDAQRRGELVWPSLDFDYEYDPPPPKRDASASDLPIADAPQADASLVDASDVTASGGSTGTGGVFASGGQSGAAGSSTTSAGGAGGAGGSGGQSGAAGSSTTSAGGAGGSGGQSGAAGSSSTSAGGAGGSGDIVKDGAVGSGGQSGTGSQSSSGFGKGGCTCYLGPKTSAPALVWVLLAIAIGLVGRGRRRAVIGKAAPTLLDRPAAAMALEVSARQPEVVAQRMQDDFRDVHGREIRYVSNEMADVGPGEAPRRC